mgnify:CR=1 FL=1
MAWPGNQKGRGREIGPWKLRSLWLRTQSYRLLLIDLRLLVDDIYPHVCVLEQALIFLPFSNCSEMAQVFHDRRIRVIEILHPETECIRIVETIIDNNPLRADFS